MLRAFRAFRFGFFEVRVTLDGARESGNRIKVLELEKSPVVERPLQPIDSSTGFLRLDPGFDAGGIEAVLVAAYQAGEDLQAFPARPIAFWRIASRGLPSERSGPKALAGLCTRTGISLGLA